MVLFNYILQVTDINFRLYGSYWSRYSEFKSKYYGYAYGDDYRKVLIESKIALCLLRHANRDGHAMRSYEIPACGVFMLAERSAEHTLMFIEDREAVFFTEINELISKVRYYHSHEIERQKIAYRGYQRITESRNTYLDRLEFLFHLLS
jgi:spore maturation protein CgeB